MTALTEGASCPAYRGSMRPLAALVCALALLLAACGTDTEEASSAGTDTTASSATVAPAESPSGGGDDAEVPAVLDFRSETVDGEAFDGTELAGTPTVFWFWAPWCPTCRAQISGVGALAADHGADVDVVGVGSLDEAGAIEEFADQVSPDVTLLSDAEGAVWRHFGVTAQSTYLVLDAEGDEQAKGYLDDGELANLVDDLVG